MSHTERIPRRILHTSDVHLESYNDKACQCFEATIDAALRNEVDLVIIAGDFFDSNRIDEEVVNFAIKQLQRLPVYAIILPGNHDPLVPESVYFREKLWQQVDNIFIFHDPQGEIFELPGISIWGKALTSYAGDLRPLEGVLINQETGLWHVAIAHGYYVSDDSPLFPSYHIAWQEIVSSQQDYIALGHVAVYRRVCDDPVKAYYSGGPPISRSVNIIDFREEIGVQVMRYSIDEERAIEN